VTRVGAGRGRLWEEDTQMVSAEKKLEKYFSDGQFDGMLKGDVIDALRASGAMYDKQLHVSIGEEQLVCRINYDKTTVGLVKASYDIIVKFDEDNRVHEVTVKRNLTGL
jgi:hypothetical protein